MKLKHVMGARLDLDNGQSVILERLGKGMFHTCYVDRATGQVYSVTIERPEGSDYSKEILSGCDPNPHIPVVEALGNLENSDNRVYRMPLYQPLKAANREAWALLKRLEQAKEDAWRGITREQGFNTFGSSPKMRLSDIGYMVNQKVIQIMDGPGVPQSLKEALQSLADEAASYGNCYVFEFSRRNVMVDANGTIILLDVLFSLKVVEAISKRRRTNV